MVRVYVYTNTVALEVIRETANVWTSKCRNGGKIVEQACKTLNVKTLDGRILIVAIAKINKKKSIRFSARTFYAHPQLALDDENHYAHSYVSTRSGFASYCRYLNQKYTTPICYDELNYLMYRSRAFKFHCSRVWRLRFAIRDFDVHDSDESFSRIRNKNILYK